MKCTNKTGVFLVLAFVVLLGSGCRFSGFQSVVEHYETKEYEKRTYVNSLYSDDLCVVPKEEKKQQDWGLSGADSSALFNEGTKETLHAFQVYKQLYPASVTKILTALVALEHGNLQDTVTVSRNGAASSFPSYAQVCGLQEGDRLSLEALLCGLLLHSGNDSAVAVAEHIGGTEEKFVDMMNQKAAELLATDTHFTNPSGLHDDEHYTTAYDLYLIFHACIRQEAFVNIIRMPMYTASITGRDGSVRQVSWEPTNYYARGLVASPQTAVIAGGKTGTTDEAGNCLILLEYANDGTPYVSVVMGAKTKELLYQDMSALIEQISP
ncbi:D-alanyl-D-alanine carboxypeptidase [Suipraeoptans intestinalis]|uniref:D-alanyl-D-alanine carboxypeptidase family protein n=1 Tax=Suipraeoptans intestinalis TaxID=2606628 RepID=UPI002A76266D|nr:D-alanyl-D-alanine carboxypeptidase [Suipraeoptans intestinalis]MDY3122111.1 D-alanyl-D-alanine carboxypeptidase [Suipraeoptans intestinalis]